MASALIVVVIAVEFFGGLAERLRVLFNHMSNWHGYSNRTSEPNHEVTPECRAQKEQFESKCLDQWHRTHDGTLPGGLLKRLTASLAIVCKIDSIPMLGDAAFSQAVVLLPASLYSWLDECSLALMKGIQPSLWTGAMIKATGFADFLSAIGNRNFRLLHHGTGRYKQGSLFGASITSANYFDKCSDSFQRKVWEYGSALYATYNSGFRAHGVKHICPQVRPSSSAARAMFDMADNLRAWQATETTMFDMVVFVGHKFGLRRPGSESILFKYELPALITTWKQVTINGFGDNSDFGGKSQKSLAFLNFSPQSCAEIYKVELGEFETRPFFEKEEHFVRKGSSLGSLFRATNVTGIDTKFADDLCVRCNVADQSNGPSRAEIENCLAAARQKKENAERA